MNTIEFYRDLKDTIRENFDDTVFYQDKAPKSAKVPYVVFRLESMVDTSPTTNAILKFMIYDNSNKTSEDIEKLANKLHGLFNKSYKVCAKQSYHTVLSIRQNIPSEYLVGRQCIELQYDTVIYERSHN